MPYLTQLAMYNFIQPMEIIDGEEKTTVEAANKRPS